MIDIKTFEIEFSCAITKVLHETGILKPADLIDVCEKMYAHNEFAVCLVVSIITVVTVRSIINIIY